MSTLLDGWPLDDDGSAKLGERRYVAAWADDGNGAGGYLEFRFNKPN
ncbi:hypothetical protein [Tardiphaga sp. OK246]|jgi:hypothetical protein|nr:hypothetical protein [Tardiphaga sp. OK246]